MLAEGCICALRGEHRRRGLQRRLDALLDSLRAADAARELQAVSREQRIVAEATRELRSQLAVMREHWLAVGRECLSLA